MVFCFKKSPWRPHRESVMCVGVEGVEAMISVTRLSQQSRKKGAAGLGLGGISATGTMDGFGMWFEGRVDRPC